MPEKIIFTWSGGKDSARALYEIRKDANIEVTALLTTISQDYNRVSIHGLKSSLLYEQTQSLGLPLEKIFISKTSSNEEYDNKMRDTLLRYQGRGISRVAFGDIFLEDLRKYREENLARIGLKAIFPIWKRDTLRLAQEFLELGFKAVITCVDSKVLDKAFAGRLFDRDFLSALPVGVDPCGENGEFHSFVFDGPIFQKSIDFKKGEVVLRDNRFYYCDLLPVNGGLAADD